MMIDQRYAPYGASLLRMSLGTMWIAHAWLKWSVFTIAGFAGWLDSIGFPGFMAWPVFMMELIGGIMIMTGAYARYASVFLLPVIIAATVTHVPNGWLHINEGGGWEYPVFLTVTSIAHILIGDGAYALRPTGIPNYRIFIR